MKFGETEKKVLYFELKNSNGKTLRKVKSSDLDYACKIADRYSKSHGPIEVVQTAVVKKLVRRVSQLKDTG